MFLCKGATNDKGHHATVQGAIATSATDIFCHLGGWTKT